MTRARRPVSAAGHCAAVRILLQDCAIALQGRAEEKIGERVQERLDSNRVPTRRHLALVAGTAALLTAGLLGGCAGGSAGPKAGSGATTAPSGSDAVIAAYAQVQGEVEAAVRAGGPGAVEAALAASTVQVAKEGDAASVLGREVRLRVTAADPGSPALSGCAILWIRDGVPYWRGYYCGAEPPADVELPEGQVPPSPSPPVPNGPLAVDAAGFAAIMSALPPSVTALEAYAQIDAAMRALSGPGPLPRIEARIAVAADGGIDVAAAAFSYDDRSCVMATRLSGTVEAWRPARVQVQPGEGSCDSSEAMRGLYKRPPH